jgi:hypothetical protein
VLANIKEQVADTMAKFNDDRMNKLKQIINTLKDQDIRNSNLRSSIQRSDAKLEKMLAEQGREGKLQNLLVEFDT